MIEDFSEKALKSYHGLDRQTVSKVITLLCQLEVGSRLETTVGTIVRVSSSEFMIEHNQSTLNELADDIVGPSDE